jgi:glucose-1-phosphate thymidylyltransferase
LEQFMPVFGNGQRRVFANGGGSQRGFAWLDTGTHQGLLEASHFIVTIEARQGLKVACLKEVAYRKGFVDRAQMLRVIEETPKSSYREYLETVDGAV